MTFRLGVGVLGLTAILLNGCSKTSNNTAAAIVTRADATPATLTPREIAEPFLKSLGEGKVTLKQLTPTCLKQIAPPTKADKEGFNELDAIKFLARFENTRFIILEEIKINDAMTFRGRAETLDVKDAFTLRLIGTPDGLKVAWLHRSERMAMNIPYPSDATLAEAQDTLRTFLDLLIGDDPSQARELMAMTWRQAAAPPPPTSARSYDEGFLTQKLKAWRGGALNYTIQKADLDANRETATFTVELEADGKKIPHSAKVSKDKSSGQWIVEAFAKS